MRSSLKIVMKIGACSKPITTGTAKSGSKSSPGTAEMTEDAV